MRRHWLAGVAFACVTLVAQARVELIVTQVGGHAQSAARPLALLDRLASGDTIELAAGASLVVFLQAQSRQWTLAGPGRFRVDADGPAREGSGAALRPDAADPAIGQALQRRSQVLAGAIVRGMAGNAADAADGIERIAPTKPLFRWRARPHRGHWTFRLRGELGQSVFETRLAQTELALPDTVRLEPGRRYLRELEWFERDGAVRVETAPVLALGAADDAELAALRPAPDAPLSARVLYALYLRSLGVRALALHVAPELIETSPVN